MSRTITQEIKINSSPSKIYNALSVASQFSDFTGAKAEINLESGGKISLFDGMITGITVEAIENTRLIQVWRVSNWDEGYYSLVRFELDGDDSNTTLRIEHIGFPEDAGEHLESGWHKMYWDPLKQFLS